jgi:hypothetical protein
MNAVAVATNCVRVTVSALPKASSATAVGDALNPATWSVFEVVSGTVHTVLSSSQFSPLEFDLQVLEPFAAYPTVHRTATSTLLSLAGGLVAAPKSADFLGVVAHKANATPNPLVDLKNRPTATSGGTGGTLVVTDGGDYAAIENPELVRKLIYRRLGTPRGAFFHLPNYGLAATLKKNYTVSDLVAMRQDCITQAELEDEVDSADATVSLSQSGILDLQLAADLKPWAGGGSVAVSAISGMEL